MESLKKHQSTLCFLFCSLGSSEFNISSNDRTRKKISTTSTLEDVESLLLNFAPGSRNFDSNIDFTKKGHRNQNFFSV